MGVRVVGFSGAGFGAAIGGAVTNFGATAGFCADLGGELGRLLFAAGSWAGVVLESRGCFGSTSSPGDSVSVAPTSLGSSVLIVDSSEFIRDRTAAQPGRTGQN